MTPLLLSAAALAIASHALEIGALSCALVVGLGAGYLYTYPYLKGSILRNVRIKQ